MAIENQTLLLSIIEAVQKQHPALIVAGASEDMLAALEVNGLDVPPLLRALLSMCNGSFPFAFFPQAMELMDCELIEATSYMAQEHEFAAEEEDEVDARIQAIYYHHQRLPFATCNGDVDLLIDFAPSATGQKGQIIYQDVECGILRWVAPSLEAFLLKYWYDLENNMLVWDEYGDLVAKTGDNWY